MTKLPSKALLEGTKEPETTTGEFRLAMGNIRQFLAELFGDESTDKETARMTMGIDLGKINSDIAEKADRETVAAALDDKVGTAEFDSKVEKIVAALTQEIAKNRTPIGTIVWFAASQPPVGYLKADGASVWRETYPELFAVIGTTFGGKEEDPTFSLPNLMGRFAEGSATPGIVKEAGLPEIWGNFAHTPAVENFCHSYGAMAITSYTAGQGTNGLAGGAYWKGNTIGSCTYEFRASRSNSTYGASDTVQPPALTLLPCIKAFHA